MTPPHDHQSPALPRRSLLRGSAAAALAVAAGPLLSACGASPSPNDTAVANSKVVLPTYRKPTAGKPDLPGAENVQDVFFNFPADRPAAVNHSLGNGGDLRAMVMTYSSPPTPLGQNTYWQALNKKLNTNLIPDLVPEADYLGKFSTVIAGGGDLPDIIMAPVFKPLPRLDDLVKTQFADLTEYLSADAVLKYPNLAGIPTDAWRDAVSQGRIWGVPIPGTNASSLDFVRMDLSKAAGFPEVPKSQAEYLEWAKALTKSDGSQYAIGSAGNTWLALTSSGMYELPNQWQLDGDTATSVYAHPAYYDALDFIKKVWKLGYMYPDSPSMTNAQQKTLFWQGKIACCQDGAGWFVQIQEYPEVDMGGRPAYTLDGSKPHVMQSDSAFSVNAIRGTADKAKIEELLNIIDYLASPFGSQEDTDLRFGIEGDQFNFVNGQPVPVKERTPDFNINARFIGNLQPPLYNSIPALNPVYSRFQGLQKEVAPGLVRNPFAGLRSETNQRSGNFIQDIDDARVDYILDRKPLQAVKDAVAKYTKEAEPQIKAEYLAGLKARG